MLDASSESLSHKLILKMRREVSPALKVRSKKALKLHVIINWILNICHSGDSKDAYLKRFWTYFWSGVAYPDGCNTDTKGTPLDWRALGHECIHAVQEKKWGAFLFSILYLFPISLGILLLATCWLPLIWASGWVLAIWIGAWALLGLACFIPGLPCPWRKVWELEAYSASMYFQTLLLAESLSPLKRGSVPEWMIEWLVENFTSMTYWKMVRDENSIRSKLCQIASDINRGTAEICRHPVVEYMTEEYPKSVQ